MIKSATLNETRTHRFDLVRRWNYDQPIIMWGGGLNPSTADAYEDDPTIRRCIGFTKDMGYGGFVIVNLFSFRSPHPNDVKRKYLEDKDVTFGKWNTSIVQEWLRRVDKVIPCWGTNGSWAKDQVMEMCAVVVVFASPCQCLGYTKEGHPKHPLMVPRNVPIETFDPMRHYYDIHSSSN